MKTKIIIIWAVILSNYCSVAEAQGLGLPSNATLEQIARESGVLSDNLDEDAVAYEEGDFNPPSRGRLRKADIKSMRADQVKISANLLSVPNDNSGKQSPWYASLSTWNQGFQKAIDSEMEKDLFSLIPVLMAVVERNDEGEELCKELIAVETYMVHSGSPIIRALSYHVVHEQGVVAADLLRQAVRLFGNGRLVDETAWDVDDPMPVDSAGVFILNPELAVEELKKRPVKRVRFFLTNVTEPSEFFRRYVGEGDGLEVLKARYAANKEVIDAKHQEVVAWLAAQPKE